MKVLVAQSCPTLATPWTVASPVCGILQTSILKWAAIPFSRDLPDPGIELVSPAFAGRFCTIWATREALSKNRCMQIFWRGSPLGPKEDSEMWDTGESKFWFTAVQAGGQQPVLLHQTPGHTHCTHLMLHGSGNGPHPLCPLDLLPFLIVHLCLHFGWAFSLLPSPDFMTSQILWDHLEFKYLIWVFFFFFFGPPVADSFQSGAWKIRSSHSWVTFSTFIGKVVVLVAQSCLTPWDPSDCSPPGFSVHGILQARILEWVALLHIWLLAK